MTERDINPFFNTTDAGFLASVVTLDNLKSEAEKGKRSDFEHYLSMVPDMPAQPGDKAS